MLDAKRRIQTDVRLNSHWTSDDLRLSEFAKSSSQNGLAELRAARSDNWLVLQTRMDWSGNEANLRRREGAKERRRLLKDGRRGKTLQIRKRGQAKVEGGTDARGHFCAGGLPKSMRRRAKHVKPGLEESRGDKQSLKRVCVHLCELVFAIRECARLCTLSERGACLSALLVTTTRNVAAADIATSQRRANVCWRIQFNSGAYAAQAGL
jgi:hypothetical protein